jgi:glycosyltransferase involved in cell wall biosynthesis
VRIVIDYRPALRARTGVGEYIHQATRSLAQAGTGDSITLFSSSWKDRPAPDLAREIPNVRVIDRRIPVSALNLAWHRVEWPPIEALARERYDVAHSPHPLLMPTRSAAQVITVHDIYFLSHPERSAREIRRDYPSLARSHAQRADRIIVSSKFAAGQIQSAFDLPADKIAVCPAGAPTWTNGIEGGDPGGYLLFLGTLDSRKNISGLLDAYGAAVSRAPGAPRLILAGAATSESPQLLERLTKAPLAGRVEYLGFVDEQRRATLFRGARLLLLPSFEEGFGLTALEAMSAGVPVVASSRGSLPEVIGDAGLLVDPDDASSIAGAIERVLSEAELWRILRTRGRERSRQFSWAQTARDIRRAYDDAITVHANRH